MINHARSLLLNDIAANRPELGTFGEEYVPEAYRKLNYNGTLLRVRNALLGSVGDPLYENYRLAQLMAFMHSNQYSESLILELDTRYTYRPFQASFMQFDTSIEVEEVDSKGLQLAATGTPRANEAVGQALYRWRVRTATGPVLQVQLMGLPGWREYDIEIVGQDATPVTLDNGVVLQISVPIGGWQTEAEWLVTSMARPTTDAGYLIQAVNSLGASTTYDLFKAVPSSFKQLWYSGVSLVDQLGGLLGAFVTKAEAVRTNV